MVKILLVDDNEFRVRTLYSCIESLGVEIDTVSTKKDALISMERKIYDLVMIDIMLPENMSTINPSKNAGVELLNDIEGLKRIRKPYNVIGVTSDQEVYESVKSVFHSKLIPIFVWNSSNEKWKEQLTNKILYLKRINDQIPINESVDIAIITAVEEEFNSVKSLLADWKNISLDDDPTLYLSNDFIIGDVSKKILLTKLPEMGMTAASCVTTKIIKSFSPEKIYMVGICGGVRGKVELGDIIIASHTWDYGNGKIKPQKKEAESSYYEFEASPNQISSSIANIDSLKVLTEDILSDVVNEWNTVHKSNMINPNIHIAPMPSGASVICDESLFNEIIRPQHRKCVAIDMETYGVYFAATKSKASNIKFLSIKCVSDYADIEKNDDLHESCCFTSANFLLKCISKEIL